MSDEEKMIWVAGGADCSGLWANSTSGIASSYCPVGPYHHDDVLKRIIKNKDVEYLDVIKGWQDKCQAKESENARLREAVKVMRGGLDRIANCNQGDVVKYIQTVDGLALDTLSAADEILGGK